MIIAQLPTDEELRLHDLYGLDILDTPAEKEFDEIVELASYICNSPITLITLLDKDRQWFKARKGIDLDSTGRDAAFCTHTILEDDVMEVSDTHLDERFIDNPFVTEDPNIRFYAGTPIYSPGGFKVGTICVLDNRPKELSEVQRKALQTLSNQITKLLELRNVNRVIKKRAEEIILLSNEAANLVVKTQEADQRYISHQLHENMAQVLAACRMYLQLAEQNESMRLSFISTVNEQLGELISSMRNLSTSLTPAAFSSIPLEDLLREFLSRHVFSFIVEFSTRGDSGEVQPEQSIACTRILEKWLDVLEAKDTIDKVMITLSIEQCVSLLVESDGQSEAFELLERDLLRSTVYSRVQSQGGTVHVHQKNGTSIEIQLPFSEPDAASTAFG